MILKGFYFLKSEVTLPPSPYLPSGLKSSTSPLLPATPTCNTAMCQLPPPCPAQDGGAAASPDASQPGVAHLLVGLPAKLLAQMPLLLDVCHALPPALGVPWGAGPTLGGVHDPNVLPFRATYPDRYPSQPTPPKMSIIHT